MKISHFTNSKKTPNIDTIIRGKFELCAGVDDGAPLLYYNVIDVDVSFGVNTRDDYISMSARQVLEIFEFQMRHD